MSATSNAPIRESREMVRIDDLPTWIVPFLTSSYFEESHEGGGHNCVCKSRKLCRFRPYFCVQCEEGHLCKKVFKAGKRHHDHEKLRVCKVTGRNSIHVQDVRGWVGKGILADVRDYKYNHELAFSLLGNDAAREPALRQGSESGLNTTREVCKWCGRSTRAPNQESKSLCSLGCALESVFDMTLQEIHAAQLGLPTRNATDAPRVRPQESQIATTTKDMNDNETEVIDREHHRIVPNNMEMSRDALHARRRFGNAYDDEHEGEVEEEEEADVISRMVDHKDGILRGDCVNGSLQSPVSKLNNKKRARRGLDERSETYDPRLTFEDTSVEPSSIQVGSTSKATPKLDTPDEIKRASQIASKGKRQREIEARNHSQNLARIMKAPRSGSHTVSIDLDMFHNLCLLAYGEVHTGEAEEENVEEGAPSS